MSKHATTPLTGERLASIEYWAKQRQGTRLNLPRAVSNSVTLDILALVGEVRRLKTESERQSEMADAGWDHLYQNALEAVRDKNGEINRLKTAIATVVEHDDWSPILWEQALISALAGAVIDESWQPEPTAFDVFVDRFGMEPVGACAEPDPTIGVIAIGEPGCYAVCGHLLIGEIWEALQIILRDHDEEIASLEVPRHSWMIVTRHERDTDGDGIVDDEDILYREVLAGTPGARPYTIFACKGWWYRPSQVEQEGVVE